MRFNVARHRFGRRAALQEQDEPFYRLEAVFIGDAEAVEKARRRFETRQRLTVIGS
jgi:hypothetical protein